jgi:Uma2 family endonuclease
MVSELKEISTPKTLAEFEQWQPTDGYKYEWNDGELIKFEGMKRKHLKLVRALTELFDTTKAKKQRGQLICEQDVQLSGIQLRRPDLAFFSGEQIDESDTEEEPIPEFAIEVISSHDQINEVKKKIIEYFKNGVKVTWLIYPEYQMVEVYTSAKNVIICTDSDVCSASPVLDDFEIRVEELFSK